MNLLLIKRIIRKNPKTRRFVDFCYALLTRQYIEYSKGSHKILNCKKNTGGGVLHNTASLSGSWFIRIIFICSWTYGLCHKERVSSSG